jgi:hypothetical protein
LEHSSLARGGLIDVTSTDAGNGTDPRRQGLNATNSGRDVDPDEKSFGFCKFGIL